MSWASIKRLATASICGVFAVLCGSNFASAGGAGVNKNEPPTLTATINRMWRGLGPSMVGPDMVLKRGLSYHVVVRLDDHTSEKDAHDIHIPSAGKAASTFPEPLQRLYSSYYGPSLQRALDHFSKCDFRPEPVEKNADILIHINLAERAGASAGFEFKSMSLHPERKPELWISVEEWAKTPLVSQHIYTLPWTIVRLHNQYVGPKKPNVIAGAEIWIEYPIRSAWQEIAAQQVLSNVENSGKLGLGETRNEIISRFQIPSQSQLEPLDTAMRGIVIKQEYPRPGETLLSIATDQLLAEEGMIYESHDPFAVVIAGVHQHSDMIAWQLMHALSIVTGSMRAGARFVGPRSGDYFQAFEANPSRIIAEEALLSSQKMSDRARNASIALALSRYVCREVANSKEIPARPPGSLSAEDYALIEKAESLSKPEEDYNNIWGISLPVWNTDKKKK